MADAGGANLRVGKAPVLQMNKLHFLLIASCLQVSPIDLQSHRTVTSGCYTKLSNPRLDFACLTFPMQLSQERGMVGKCADDIGMPWAQRLLPNLQSAKKDRFGILISAAQVVCRAEIAQYLEHLRVLPAEGFLVDTQSAPEKRLGLAVLVLFASNGG